MTVSPKEPVFGENTRKFYKVGYPMNQVLVRYFVLDDRSFIYFKEENSMVAKGVLSLNKATCQLEDREGVIKRGVLGGGWHDSQHDFRLIIGLPQRHNEPFFVYSSDKHELKALLVKIRLAANPDMKQTLNTCAK